MTKKTEQDDLIVEDVILEQDGLVEESKVADKKDDKGTKKAKKDCEESEEKDDEEMDDKEIEESISDGELDEAAKKAVKEEDDEEDDKAKDDEEDESDLDEAAKKAVKEKEDESDDDKKEDDDEEEVDESADQIADSIIDRVINADSDIEVTEDIEALVAGEESLTEDFKAKATIIFEAAVSEKAREQVKEYKGEFTKQVIEMQNDLTEQVDEYMTFVVEKWLEDNNVAVTNLLRTEIAEGFMASIKDTFTEHYIEMPAGKENVFDSITEKLTTAEESLVESDSKIEEMNKELTGLKREKIIADLSEDLADTQVEKLKSLVEDVSFDDVDAFTKKVETIKESYFTGDDVSEEISEEDENVITTTVIEETDKIEVSSQMEKYINATRKLKKLNS